MTSSFTCSACGGPNTPQENATHIMCAYCGANLTIPDNLRIKKSPQLNPKPSESPTKLQTEQEAADFIRKVQPSAIKLWNAFTVLGWLRRLVPSCLIVFFLAVAGCLALGVLPFLLTLGNH